MNKNIIALLLSLCMLQGCQNRKQQEETGTDLPQLLEKGEITAVTLYSSSSYFEYRSESMGYEYDLIKGFALSHGLKLNIKVAENNTRLVEMLQTGEADVVAYPIPLDNKLKQEVIYCGRQEFSNQVLIQRGGRGEKVLKDVTELIGKEIVIKPGTRYDQRLQNMNNELGGGITIRYIEQDTITTEDLIEMVALGKIDYTVSEDRIARLNKTYFRNLNIDLPVSFQQQSSWIVRKDSPLLAEAIDQWVAGQSGTQTFQSVVKRYFELSKQPEIITLPKVAEGKISPYDSIFRKYAPELGWDWQLLASICYQESRFQNNQVSWAGAQGLMGIMPNTARALGVEVHELNDPEVAIKTGVECLKRFRRGFRDIEDPVEVIKFTLASYNAGVGHINDARRLAEKYGRTHTVWDSHVADFIRMKSQPEYYNDPLCQHGYLRGMETFNYVIEVLERYEHYKEYTF